LNRRFFAALMTNRKQSKSCRAEGPPTPEGGSGGQAAALGLGLKANTKAAAIPDKKRRDAEGAKMRRYTSSGDGNDNGESNGDP
jgi:hypothetical protein